MADKNIFSLLANLKSSVIAPPPKAPVAPQKSASWSYQNVWAISYTGEKNLGELGPIKDYYLDYDALRYRSWQCYLESEISQIVLNKFAIWVIGSGLKLQAEPDSKMLEMEGIEIDTEEFNDSVEARFGAFASSKEASYSKMDSLSATANEAFKNSIIGGDVLVVLRVNNGKVSVQLIDGQHVQSPFDRDRTKQIKDRGNRIKDGVEISKTGEHVAYWVREDFYSYKRVKAKSRTGLTMAFLVYGMKYRLDNHRGIPLVSVVLETIKKLERYKEATVGSAEERQKIAYQVVHDDTSTGENPLQGILAKAVDADAVVDDIPTDDQGEKLADTVAATTNKMAFNMPKGAKLDQLKSENELYFKDFYTVNIDLVCASLGIPPEVALSKYDSNFSSSRAALKDWEHTISVNRKSFKDAFYQNIYNLWLEVQVLKNKVKAPGYLSRDQDVLESYRKCRFTGANIPHIDPEKEVRAVRLKLGDKGVNMPLTTVEAATEELNGGDSKSNMKQFSKELEESKSMGIDSDSPQPDNNED